MYKLNADGKVTCEKNGKEVAEFKEGNLVFMPGMVMEHKKKLITFLEGKGLKIANIASQNKPEPCSEPNPPGDPYPGTGTLPPLADLQKDPPFDKYRGVRTPGFPEWAAGRSQEEITAMVRKLER